MIPHKIFVLDTSVILYDHRVVDSFEEHDVAIPLTVLEELDRFKTGNGVLNRNAREFIRRLDEISGGNLLNEWIPLNGADSGRVRVLPAALPVTEGPLAGASNDNDQRILLAALSLVAREPGRPVILVSKDINLRIRARAHELVSEDYKRAHVADPDHPYTGRSHLELEAPGLIDRLAKSGRRPIAELTAEPPPPQHFFVLTCGRQSMLAYYDGDAGELVRITKPSAYGISPRNVEQTFALDAILDPRVQLVSLTGPAGTGKTLLSLAGALEQRRCFRQIYLTRPIIPLSNKDIGYLPGDVQSKISPYMQPLWDNLAFIKGQLESNDRAYRKIDEMVESKKLEIIPLAYIRGRTFSRVLLIVDEAQNLTPHEVKTIVTRAGEDTKVVLCGDVQQIDTPYLDRRSNGLSYLIDRMKGQPLYAHVHLERGVRSPLANLASELL